MTTQVTTSTIVEELWDYNKQVKDDPKIDLVQKIKLTTTICDRILRAGALNLGYQRAVSRLPEGAAAMIPTLNAPAVIDPPKPRP